MRPQVWLVQAKIYLCSRWRDGADLPRPHHGV